MGAERTSDLVPPMCKAAGGGMVMTNLRVLEKHGDKSGSWTAGHRRMMRRYASGCLSPCLPTVRASRCTLAQ